MLESIDDESLVGSYQVQFEMYFAEIDPDALHRFVLDFELNIVVVEPEVILDDYNFDESDYFYDFLNENEIQLENQRLAPIALD